MGNTVSLPKASRLLSQLALRIGWRFLGPNPNPNPSHNQVALAAREPASINATNLVASTAFRRIVVSGCSVPGRTELAWALPTHEAVIAASSLGSRPLQPCRRCVIWCQAVPGAVGWLLSKPQQAGHWSQLRLAASWHGF